MPLPKLTMLLTLMPPSLELIFYLAVCSMHNASERATVQRAYTNLTHYDKVATDSEGADNAGHRAGMCVRS